MQPSVLLLLGPYLIHQNATMLLQGYVDKPKSSQTSEGKNMRVEKGSNSAAAVKAEEPEQTGQSAPVGNVDLEGPSAHLSDYGDYVCQAVRDW